MSYEKYFRYLDRPVIDGYVPAQTPCLQVQASQLRDDQAPGFQAATVAILKDLPGQRCSALLNDGYNSVLQYTSCSRRA